MIFLFALLGVGNLISWNIVVTADEYFRDKFKGSRFEDNFQNYFAIGFITANFLSLMHQTYFGMRYSHIRKVLGSLLVKFMIFAVLTIMTFIRIDPTVSFVMTFLLVLLCGIMTGILQNGLFSLVAVFPSKNIVSVNVGHGIAGILACLLVILAQVALKDVKMSATLFFSLAAVILISCLFAALSLRKTTLYKQLIDTQDEQVSLEELDTLQVDPQTSQVFRKIWPLLIAVFLDCLVTLALFPAIVGLVEPISEGNYGYKDVLFIPISFLLFSVGDFVGKMLPGGDILQYTPLKNMSRRSLSYLLLFWSVARFAFIPLIMACNLSLKGTSIPLLINSDVEFWIIIIVFAFSNGYLSSVALLVAPQLVDEDGYQILHENVNSQKQKEMAGALMVFFLMFGLTVGSFLSFFVRSSLCGWCNPFES